MKNGETVFRSDILSVYLTSRDSWRREMFMLRHSHLHAANNNNSAIIVSVITVHYWFSPRGTARRNFKRTGRDSTALLGEEVTPVLALRNAITDFWCRVSRYSVSAIPARPPSSTPSSFKCTHAARNNRHSADPRDGHNQNKNAKFISINIRTATCDAYRQFRLLEDIKEERQRPREEKKRNSTLEGTVSR